MLYRKTRNKIIVCALLLLAVILILPNIDVMASANNDVTTFSPFLIIKQPTNSSDDEEDIHLINVNEGSASDGEYFFDPEGLTTEKNTNTNNKILIYHTHTNEAYLETTENRFQNLAARSDNYNLTVKAVGDALQKGFANMGIDSNHSVVNNERNGYSSAYKTSKECINEMVAQNGEYRVYIDLHRDAYVGGGMPTIEIDGKSVARVMLVVGGKAQGSDKNNAFALKVADELNKIHPKLCKKVLFVQNSIYNQDVSDHCLLVEVGDNAVSVEEACNAAEYVAKAVSKVLNAE